MTGSVVELPRDRKRERGEPLPPAMLVAVVVVGAFLLARPGARSLAVEMGVLLVGTVAVVRCPPLGLAALIVGSLVIPFTIGTGTQTELNASVLLVPGLLALWVLGMLGRHDLRLHASRPILPLLLLALVAVLALLAGSEPWIVFAQNAPMATQLGGLAVFVFSAGAFLLMAHQVLDMRWLRRLTWLFLGLSTLYIARAFGPEVQAATAAFSLRGADDSPLWVWIIALAGAFAMFDRSLPVPARLGFAALALTAEGVCFFLKLSWISGWLPGLVVILVLLWLRAWRVGLVVTLAAVIALQLYPEALASLQDLKQYSTDTRLLAWQIITDYVIPANPLLGLGPANYYWYTPLFPILGYYVKFNSHNNYVDIIAQTGLLGMGCFVWFAIEMARLGWRLRSRVQPGFANAYVHAVLAGLAGMLVSAQLGDWVLPFVYNIGFQGFRASVLGWLFLGGLVVVQQTVGRPADAGCPAPAGSRSAR